MVMPWSNSLPQHTHRHERAAHDLLSRCCKLRRRHPLGAKDSRGYTSSDPNLTAWTAGMHLTTAFSTPPPNLCYQISN